MRSITTPTTTARRIRTTGTLVALLAAATLGAACSDEAAALTAEEWRAQGNALCAAGQARSEAAYESLTEELRLQGIDEPTPARLQEMYDEGLASIEQQLVAIDELRPPTTISADVEAWLAEARAAVAEAASLEPEEAFETAVFASTVEHAAELGLTECGDDEAETEAPVEPVEPGVEFVYPADGARVSSPVPLTMRAVGGLTIEPAGEVHHGAGHLHLTIDAPCVEPGQPIPSDDNHRHFGRGQTGVNLDLAPGEHTLCLQIGDGAHTALEFTSEMTVTVVR